MLLFVAIIRLIPAGDGEQFASRTQDSFYSFVNLPTIFFPLAAVLLSLLVRPRHPKAKLITVIALVEYAVAAFFGVVFGILVGLIQIAGFSVRTAFEEFLVRLVWLAVFALAGFAVYKIWRGLFYVPKPVAPPGVYGQPQYGAPGAYPGQPGYGQPGQPGSGQPSRASPARPAAAWPARLRSAAARPARLRSAGPAAARSAGLGQPAQPAGRSSRPMASRPTASRRPRRRRSGASRRCRPSRRRPSPPPAPAGRRAGPAIAGRPVPRPATAAVRRRHPGRAAARPHDGGRSDDRTEIVRDERPGFGPADEDPPRR